MTLHTSLTKRVRLIVALAACFCIGQASHASAANYYWNVTSGDWATSANWNLGAVPTSTSGVYINNGGTAAVTTTGSASSLYVGYAATDSGAVSLTGGSLSTSSEQIGFYGLGSFCQTDGLNAVRYSLELGYTNGASGQYSLNGGTVSAKDEDVGYSGTGIFLQTGGANTIAGTLAIARSLGAVGTYSLDAGQLSAAYEQVGLSGKGTLTQTGGTNVVGSWLYIANASSSVGAYSLSGGSLTAYRESVGAIGKGSFYQSGGIHTVTWYFSIDGVAGTYDLSDGNLIVAATVLSEYVGYSGTGVFTQSGGTHSLDASLMLGYNSAASGAYDLSAGCLSAVKEYVGYSGKGLFTQTGGTNSVGYLAIGTHGTYALSGGTLILSRCSNQGVFDLMHSSAAIEICGVITESIELKNVINAENASLSIDSHSLIIVADGVDPVQTPGASFSSFKNEGFYHQLGTKLTIASTRAIMGAGTISDFVECQGGFTARGGSLTLTNGISVSGSVDLDYGSLYVNDAVSGISSGSLLRIYNTYIGSAGTGVFTQAGGSVTVGYSINLGYTADSVGSYTLNAGQLLVSAAYGTYSYEHIGYAGVGVFTQTGGTNDANSYISLGSESGGSGQYYLRDGKTSASTELIGYYGTGAFIQTGGTNFVKKSMYLGYNNGAYGSYELAGGTLSSAGTETVGAFGSGVFTQTGGTNVISAYLLIGSSGTYNFEGGVLVTNSIFRSSGSAFNFGGGTLQLTKATTVAIPLTLTGTGGNANVDTNGFAVTLSGTLSGVGGLTKLGSGVLTLTGTETFTGGLSIQSGTLVLTSTESNVATLDAETAAGSVLSIAGGTHTLDSITGGGTTTVSGSAVLTVACLVQDTLILGGSGASETAASVAIAAEPCVASASATTAAVPEPTVLVTGLFLGIGLASSSHWRSKWGVSRRPYNDV